MAPTERSSLQTIEQIKTEALGYLRSNPHQSTMLSILQQGQFNGKLISTVS